VAAKTCLRNCSPSQAGGFGDHQIAVITGSDESRVRKTRERLGILPFVKQIDTLAAGTQPRPITCISRTTGRKTTPREGFQVRYRPGLRSLPHRKFSRVRLVLRQHRHDAQELGYRTIVINCNPETVSTDYNECDALYSTS